MTTDNCTPSPTDLRNIAYPTLVRSSFAANHVAEDTGEYAATPGADAAIAPALKHLELKATGKTLTGQINRLYGLANLLLPDEQPTDRSGEALRQIAIELEHAADIIEATVNTLMKAMDEDGSTK